MIRISACVIAKNEEKNIGRWLVCVQKLADEVIVVDTGSTDATVALAKKAGAKVSCFAWCNDFSAAKNFALAQAAGEWILFLDADEAFSPQSMPLVRAVVRRYHPNRKVVGIVCRLINIDQDDNNRFCGEVCQVRIFRNLRTIRFTGAVHETLQNISGAGRVLQYARELVIYHTGYSSRIVRQKLERNFAILQAQIAERGEREEDYLYLTDCYFGMEEYEKAAEYARRAIATKVRFIGMEGHADSRLIASLRCLHRPLGEVLAAINAAMEKYPEAPEFPLIQGMVYWDVRDYVKAEAAFLRGLSFKDAIVKSQDGQQALTMSDNAGRLWPYAYMYLGKLAELRFDAGKAFDYYLLGLKLYPYEPSIFACLYRCLAGQPAADVIQLLNGIYDKQTDADWLANRLRSLSAGAVYLYYARLADRRELEDAAGYMAAGRYDAAAVQAGDFLESLYRLGICSAAAMQLPRQGTALSLLLPAGYQEAWDRLAGRLPDMGRAALSSGLLPILQRQQRALFPEQAAKPGPTVPAQPLVSILIPTYNRPQLFELTLRSALAQTYGNFEVIVCDNSTNDETEQLIKNYLADPHLCYQRNRAAKSKAENFQPFETLARGEYLQWLMDDDILVKEKLAKMAAVLEKHPEVMLVASQRGIIDSGGRILPSPYANLLQIRGSFGIFAGELTGQAIMTSNCNFIGEPSAVLFRRADLKDQYWRADCRGYQTISDVVMWLELLEKGDIAVFREPLSYYRRHADQEGQQPDVVLLSRIEWFRIMTEYYERGYFLRTRAEYAQGLETLYTEYQRWYKPAGCLPGASAAMSKRYEACMEKIGGILAEK